MKKIKTFFTLLIKRFLEDDIAGKAAQLSYFFLLSLFPFLIFLITLIGYLPLTVDQVLHLVARYAPGDTMALVEDNIEDILPQKNKGLLSVGIIGTLFAASNAINALMRLLNRAYETTEQRPFYISRLVSIVLTIAMVLVIVIALLLPVFGKAIGTFVFSLFGLSAGFLKVWNGIRWVISIIIMMIIFLYLFKLAPDKRLTFSEVLPGALFATIGWQLVSLAFAFYVDHFGYYSATYGSVGGVIVLMIWFYLSGLIILVGGEINATIRKMNNEEVQP
ncbi:YihY/virulence factor BrkB family protein [Salirhabdus salicampi]|uniref:YihY/virulence factor BrkB family protein n=1 Tax=Salirhabdus salicampi TaxID=476102 RepID=UPI0020C21F7E|nr:YihY/virulence factor BrkB family protein [Salirhabdus salicampi]MCP8617910.1 YihY/virulence factor BrkB family protein [Salirhabdus salicampi]